MCIIAYKTYIKMSGMRPKPGIKLKITNMREDPNNEGVAGKCYIDVSV